MQNAIQQRQQILDQRVAHAQIQLEIQLRRLNNDKGRGVTLFSDERSSVGLGLWQYADCVSFSTDPDDLFVCEIRPFPADGMSTAMHVGITAAYNLIYYTDGGYNRIIDLTRLNGRQLQAILSWIEQNLPPLT